VRVEGRPLTEAPTGEGYTWTPFTNGGGAVDYKPDNRPKSIVDEIVVTIII